MEGHKSRPLLTIADALYEVTPPPSPPRPNASIVGHAVKLGHVSCSVAATMASFVPHRVAGSEETLSVVLSSDCCVDSVLKGVAAPQSDEIRGGRARRDP